MAAGEPTAFGQPITYALYGICLIHLILCVVIMSNLVIGHPLDLGGIIVSPLVQWLYGAFTLVSIVAIICAGVGALFQVESHLSAYASILLISGVIDAIFLVAFLFLGKSCRTTHSSSNHLVATMSCGVHDGTALLCLTLLVIFKLLGLMIVNKCKNYVRAASNQKLIPFMQPAQKYSDLEPATMPPGSNQWMQTETRTLPPQAMGTQQLRSYSAPLGTADKIMASARSMMPSMRSTNTGYTSFGAKPYPGSMAPSMGPAVPVTAYGAAGKVA